jgi:RES domain-containing protein
MASAPARTAYRISGGLHRVFDGEGARRYGGRWNSPGRAAIYAGSSYAISMLERLVHINDLAPPPGDRWVRLRFPDGLAEVVEPEGLPGWDAADMTASRRFGDAWLASGRSLVLIVPSAVTREDRNAVVNPLHPDFGVIEVTPERPVRWDYRLFPAAR